ncbi:MAG: HAD-IA family hydrolase [Actinomycetota bacterium]|nr:HAD-IA family hydrolase [Actinomycetota bacterium]
MDGTGTVGSPLIEVVFLDAGETILHPHPSFPELFAVVSERCGRPLDVEAIREVQERLAPHLVDLADETGVKDPSLSAEASWAFWSYLYRRLLAELGVEDEALVQELYAAFSSSASYALFDDALPAMRELQRAGYRLGLISNFEQWLEEMLVELEVGHLFDVSVISGLEGVEKPDPAIYRLALERAGVGPENAVHVGDSPGMDMEPAASVGIGGILLDRKGRYHSRPETRIASLKELPQVVANW